LILLDFSNRIFGKKGQKPKLAKVLTNEKLRSNALQVGVHEEPQRWAEEQFAGAKLTDIRRVARVKKIAEAMAVHPGRSIPQLCGSPYAVKATYNFFKHEEATPENMQAGHRAVVLQAMRQPGVYLCLEDTTELSWSGYTQDSYRNYR
jgi:hypothetical protein